MAPITLTPISLGAVVRLRKAHPCGGFDWTVVRLGADIGLKCARCGHRVLLSRRDFERRLAKVLSQAAAQTDATQAPDVDRAQAGTTESTSK